jgi:hypothetical protein
MKTMMERGLMVWPGVVGVVGVVLVAGAVLGVVARGAERGAEQPAQQGPPPGAPAVREHQGIRAAIDRTGWGGVVLVCEGSSRDCQAGHAERVDTALQPASTFKIMNALMSVDLGTVASADTVLKWDGIVRERMGTGRSRCPSTSSGWGPARCASRRASRCSCSSGSTMTTCP